MLQHLEDEEEKEEQPWYKVLSASLVLIGLQVGYNGIFQYYDVSSK